MTSPVIKVKLTMHPTIAPVFELLFEVEVDDEPPDALGVMVDCATQLVDTGTIEDVAVTLR